MTIATRVFVEATTERPASRDAAEELVRRLSRTDARVSFRTISGSPTIDAERAASFLAWFLGERESHLAQPRVRPP